MSRKKVTLNYIPHPAWPEYELEKSIPTWMYRDVIICSKNSRSVIYGIWPVYIEIYSGPSVPNISFSRTVAKRSRFVVWQMYDKNIKIANGEPWYCLKNKSDTRFAFSELSTTTADYWTKWSWHKQKERSKWLNQCINKTHIIKKVSYKEFESAIKKSTMSKATSYFALQELNLRLKIQRDNIKLFLVENIVSKNPIAGIAVEYSPSTKIVYYMVGFHTDSAQKVPAMVGLFDYIFFDSIQNKFDFIDFGQVWQPGKPKDWKGFSEFKSKFGTQYYYAPPIRMRFEGVGFVGKIFEKIINGLLATISKYKK